MKTIVLTLALCAAACKSPPPISQGKCLVDRYEENTAVKQTCTYEGWNWTCDAKNCDRAGEATGEAPKTPEPKK